MSNYLIHYASKYYDPVKAHEYYMEHRKLVARRKTSDLDEEGQEAASYVKKQIDEEKNQEIEKVKTELDTNISDIKKQIEELKNLSAEEREKKKAEINSLIAQAKKDASAQKAELMEQLGIRIKERTEDVNEEIAADTARDQKRIETLQAQMKQTRKGDFGRKDALQKQIENIRGERAEENASKKAELQETNQADRASVSNKKTAVSEEASTKAQSYRQEYSNFVKENRAALSENVSNLRSDIQNLRQESKETINKIMADYDEMYLSELDKLHAEHTAVKSSKKSSGSGKSASSSSEPATKTKKTTTSTKKTKSVTNLATEKKKKSYDNSAFRKAYYT